MVIKQHKLQTINRRQYTVVVVVNVLHFINAFFDI